MEVSKINGYDIKDKKSVRTYDTVAAMKIDGTIKEGQHVKTRGYYSINDGGSAEYYITDTESLTDYQENLNSGLYANLVNKENISVKQFGAKGDGTTDDTTSIQNAINFAISNKSDLIVNATSEYYKITKPLKIICEVSSLGFWGGTGLSFIGENKGNCRIVKIGNYVYTEESITELNNINAVIICVHQSGVNNGSGITLDNLTLENYLNDEFNIDESSYGLYTNVSRSTYKNLNIKAYKGIDAHCFSCLFENIFFKCTINAFSIDNGTSNTFRFMYTNGCTDPYLIRSGYSTLLSVCGDGCLGTMFKLSGLGLSLINCGCESPNLRYVFEPNSTYTNVTIDGFYMFRQIGDDDNETNIDECCIVNAGVTSSFTINNLSIIENKHLTGTSYIFNVPDGDSYLNSTLNNIKYIKNYTGTANGKMKMWKTKPTGYSPQAIRTNTLDFNYFLTSNKKVYPYLGGYIDTNHSPTYNINENDISKTKSIWLDCKDKYHTENDDDVRYIGFHNVGDLQLFNDPEGRNAMGMVITKVNSRDSWETKNIPIVLSGTTSNRPSTNLYKGLQYFDETLGLPIWYDGTNWIKADGTSVS